MVSSPSRIGWASNRRLIGLGLRRDDSLLFGRERLLRLLAEVQMLLARGLRAAFAASAPHHIDQALLGRFEFRHALPQRVAIANECLSGLYQGLTRSPGAVYPPQRLEITRFLVQHCGTLWGTGPSTSADVARYQLSYGVTS